MIKFIFLLVTVLDAFSRKNCVIAYSVDASQFSWTTLRLSKTSVATVLNPVYIGFLAMTKNSAIKSQL